MTINTDQTLKLLQASIDMIEKDREIDRLKDIVKLREAEISILQCKLQRATVPFDKRTPALLRPQAG